MGIGLLPFEKIPIFIWAFLLITIGSFLIFHEDFFSWGQARALLILVGGILAFTYDIKKRYKAKLKEKEEANLEKIEP